MKHQRRGDKCLNCGEPLHKEDNFCRVCGQLNDDPNVSFGILLFDFLSNYFSLDSRFSRSIVPFLFRPGYLTNRFIEGKRVAFANPIRLYLIVSVIYFFLLSMAASNVTTTYGDDQISLAEKDANQVTMLMDSIDRVSQQNETGIDSNDLIQMDFSEDSLNNSRFENAWQEYKQMKNSGDYSTNEMIDNFDRKGFSWWESILIRQFIRIDNSDLTSVTAYLIKNASLMMFVLMPIFALILKVIYIRRRSFLYFHHLIHGIHLHTFVFLVFSMILLLDLVWALDVAFIATPLLAVYVYFSFKHVYKQGYPKTFLKVITLFLMYGTAFSLGMVLEVIISLLIF